MNVFIDNRGNKQIDNGSKKMADFEYLEQADADEFIRSQKLDAIYIKDGSKVLMLSPSSHAMTEEESEVLSAIKENITSDLDVIAKLIGKDLASFKASLPEFEPDVIAEIEEEAVTPPADIAFTRLIGAYSVTGSYPSKQAAMKKAILELGDDANAESLYQEAVKQLG